MAVYVGIDVHKRFCQAALMDDKGIILRELKFENTLEGAHRLVNLAKTIDPHVKAVVEQASRKTGHQIVPGIRTETRISLK